MHGKKELIEISKHHKTAIYKPRRNHYLLTMFQEIQKNSKEKRKELDDSVKLASEMLE